MHRAALEEGHLVDQFVDVGDIRRFGETDSNEDRWPTGVSSSSTVLGRDEMVLSVVEVRRQPLGLGDGWWKDGNGDR